VVGLSRLVVYTFIECRQMPITYYFVFVRVVWVSIIEFISYDIKDYVE